MYQYLLNAISVYMAANLLPVEPQPINRLGSTNDVTAILKGLIDNNMKWLDMKS